MNSDNVFMLVAIMIYFAAMIAIGFWANRKTNDLSDYMLGGRNLPPTVAALSAGASDMSGWLMMGLPGALYVTGLADSWIAIGLLIGAWLNWKFVAPRLRTYTEVAQNSITIPSFLENRLKDGSRMLRVVAGALILVFFTFYVSSGMVAGGVFFENSFGSNYHTGMLLVAGVTVLYTLFGGFLGASYTDMMQGLLMMVALVVVPILGFVAVGGPGTMVDVVTEVNPHAFSLFSGTTAVVVISGLAWGLGYFGQPHIVTRFMALRSAADATAGRRIGIGWMFISLVGAVFTGLTGLAYFTQHPELTLDDPEAIFLAMAQLMFHPLIAGFVLAAVLAAIMSTVSSQLIVSSSALVEDLTKIGLKRELSPRAQVWLGRGGVFLVAVIAGSLAWTQNNTILGLVAFAWAGFGSSFGPIVLLSLFWKRLTAPASMIGMICAAVTVFCWQYTPWSALYELVPGFIVNVIVAVVVSLLTKKPDVDAEFDQAVELASAKAF
ncbi:sodium/proline symporter PutP [Propionimicrobium sp. PCR01-08-3]|uniref:sodium/proline symporter PutP n=1 Tax=Propionimicrobium sp. PCR01-08-3 TaxID=3052086 RepID=UPI00255D009B|nr:sodium/proline symporter PutP [Propionimicrobium sp. PCR01-08-3]WIY81809.1 sodium/proline symporter PutP [Propionimicrobium sp. PCR01-08-3]